MGRGRGGGHSGSCSGRYPCSNCQAKAQQAINEDTSWTNRETGFTEDDEEVTFRQGTGKNEGHTLITDGRQSSRAFRRGHNHYGQNREGGGGRVEDEDGDRGHYTGRGH